MKQPTSITKAVTQYQTSDGFVFDDVSKAQDHEREIYWDNRLKHLKRELTVFEVTEAHCRAIKELNVTWSAFEGDYYFHPVTFGLNDKRPFGNSASELDLAKAMGIEVKDDERLTDEQEEALKSFFCELSVCLQILLDNLGLKPGKYTKAHSWSDWKKC